MAVYHVGNRASPDLQTSHIDGSRHNYWVDRQAGFTPEDQTALVQFLLSIDDNPPVLPDPAKSSNY